MKGVSGIRRAGRAVLAWAPVWVPVGLGVQIAVLGLRPALQEHRRLAGEEQILRERHADLSAERAELDRWMQSQGDPGVALDNLETLQAARDAAGVPRRTRKK